LCGLPPLRSHVASVIDTLVMARESHPGKKNSLDALCERHAIDHSKRTLHGALLDANLLAEVYLAMTRGQESLVMEIETPSEVAAALWNAGGVLELIVIHASSDELVAHDRQLAEIDLASNGMCVWRRLEAGQEQAQA